MLRRLSQQRHRVGNAATQLQRAQSVATSSHKAYFRVHILTGSQQRQRPYSCGSSEKNAGSAERSAPPRVVAEDEYYFNEFRDFLALDAPTEEEKQLARSRLDEILSGTLTKEILGIQATALSLVADKLEDHALVLQVYRAQRENRIQPSPLTLNIAATTCAEIDPTDDLCAWETALDIVAQMHEAVHLMPISEEIYQRAIDACSKAHQWLVALRLVDEMLRYDRPPSEATWLTVAQGCLDPGETEAALSLVEKLRSIEHAVEYAVDDVLESFLMVGVRANNSDFIIQVLDNLYRHQRARNSRLGGALSSWFGLKQLHQEPLVVESLSVGDLHKIVDLLASDRQWLELNKWLPSLGYPDYTAPRVQYGPHDYFFLAKHIFESIPAPSTQFVNAYLLTCGRHGRLSEAKAALSAHPRPDMTSYYAVVSACNDHVEEASRLYEEAVKLAARDRLYENPHHHHNHVDLLNAYLTTLSKASKHEDVLALVARDLNTDEATNRRTMSSVLVAHAKLGHWSDVVEAFKTLKTHGFSCSGYVYGSVIRAYTELGHFKHAAMLFKHIQHTDPDYTQHPAVVASMFYLFRVDENDVAAAMALFRSLDLETPPSDRTGDVLNAEGAVHLLHILSGMRNDDDRFDGNTSTILTTRGLLEEVWSALERMPNLFCNALGPHSYVVDTALLVAAKAYSIHMAEDIVTWAADHSIPFSAATYTHMMRVYSQPPILPELNTVDWAAPPAHPVRFNYWWDAMQENPSVKPNVRTVTSLLAAVRRGILSDITATDVLDAMQSAWDVPLRVEHCEICLRIWEAELGSCNSSVDAEEVWCQVVELMRRMKVEGIYYRLETIAAAAACGQAAKTNAIDDDEWFHLLVEAAASDAENVIQLVQTLQSSADVVAVLEGCNRKVSVNATVHALKTCVQDHSSTNMRRVCQWLQRHDVHLAPLSREVTVELKERLERWGEDVRDDPWRSVLFS
ncbi:hypothetical protein H310_01175 [Aphanomyces invadans]|uniref:Pentacotripeptide-repeat region of PRORP domain-containing protein n=1 Tax=Aphanomyces invadans TaxID=157072 RepID=A0A024UQQ8_9STRA|nr:hypothetical protein H310_01175 [Aphanomyces invadans]ETW08639.1 hypothetical protein H310_01175 [Aphanomyces invadans]|eukprot:XP_008862444.1 hypothetical protein H310_01175 [Aphanomyces invadans]